MLNWVDKMFRAAKSNGFPVKRLIGGGAVCVLALLLKIARP